jgi:hypothetical protein
MAALTSLYEISGLYEISDWSTKQLALGLVLLPLLVALAWYVSHPAHRRQLSNDTPSGERTTRMAA